MALSFLRGGGRRPTPTTVGPKIEEVCGTSKISLKD
jgi:hypothetical protein